MPSQFLWFSLLWQGVSYTLITVHLVIGFVALSRERTLQLADADLQALEDPDTLQRWGAESQLQSLSNLRTRGSQAGRLGLSPSKILALGGIEVHSARNGCGAE